LSGGSEQDLVPDQIEILLSPNLVEKQLITAHHDLGLYEWSLGANPITAFNQGDVVFTLGGATH